MSGSMFEPGAGPERPVGFIGKGFSCSESTIGLAVATEEAYGVAVFGRSTEDTSLLC